MATQEYRCYKECFAYNKRFKQGTFFPVTWIDAGYKPPPEYFVAAEDYADTIRMKVKEGKEIQCAADDPRSSDQLVKDLAKYMEVPKDWNRKRIWMALKQREMAESHTEPGPRKPGRPAVNKD